MRSTSKLAGNVVLAVVLLGGLVVFIAGCADDPTDRNNPPSLAAIGARLVTEGETLTFGVSATDPENNALVFSMINQPANSQLVDNGDGTAEFTFTPNYSQDGIIQTTFIVSDGKAEASETIEITVTDQEFTQHGGMVTANETWSAADNPHLISSDLDVAGGATLTIQNGCEVYFVDGKRIRVGYASAGGLKASGAIFTSVSDTPTRGIWDGISFAAQTNSESYLDNCTIEYGGGNAFGNIFVSDGVVSITDCTIENSSTNGLYFMGSGHASNFTGNTITDNAAYPVTVSCNYLGGLQGSSLTGNDRDTVIVTDTLVTLSASWDTLGVPFLITERFNISGGATLTLVPGLTLSFDKGAGIIIGRNSAGTLIADGSAGEIRFTSSKSSPSSGEWEGIYFDRYAGASSRLVNCMVEYAGETQPGGVYVTDASISVTGTTVRYSGFSGMYLTGDGRFSSFVNNTLTNNDLYPIVIAANYAGDLTTSNSYTGNATDQINVTADIIDRAATWQDLGIPYYVSGIGSVQNNGALTLAPGASLLFAAAGGFKVGAAGTGTGTLIADGSLGQITMGPAVATTNWVGIQFLDNATSTSLLDSCLIDMAGLRQSASFQGGINLTNCQVHIRHCTITRSGAVGIGFAGSAYPASMEENTITTSGSVPVSIDCDYVGYLPANNDFTGNTVNAFNLVGTAITRSATWSNPGIPFVITAVITINSGAQLTINPGLVLQFKSGSGMVVAQNATLTADGSEDQIQFVAEASGTNWEGLQFMSGSSSSSLLRACLIDEGGYQREYDASRNRYPGCVYIDNDSHPCLENCTISGSKKYGIFCKGTGYPDCFTGNVFVDNDGPPVRVEPDGVGHLKAANSFTGNVSDVIEIGGSLDNTARLGILGSTATWVDVGIPYWIEDSVRVQGGIQLTIGAGVTLQIVRPMNFGVCCGASIVCNGTAADPITFTATVNNWGKLYLQGSGNDNSVFNYCVFDRAGRDQSCGVELTNCSPSITNCTFSNTFSRACALCLIGTANPYLNNNTFTNNPGGNTCNR